MLFFRKNMKKSLLYIILSLIIFFSGSILINKLLYAKDTKVKIADFINVFEEDNKIKLEWEDSGADEYNIYRSTKPIKDASSLKKAKLLGKVKKGTEKFSDSIYKKSIDYYYAIINITKGEEQKLFVPDSNYNSIPINISPSMGLPSINDVQDTPLAPPGFYTEKKEEIEPKLEPKPEIKPTPVKTNIIKEKLIEKTPPPVTNKIIVTNNPVIEKPKDDFGWTDAGKTEPSATNVTPVEKPEEKIESEEEPPVIEKITPVIKKRKRKKRRTYSAWLTHSITNYYFKKNYVKSKKEFTKILHSKASLKTRMKAKLFLGRLYYKQGAFNKALKYFIETEKYYPDESIFWRKKIYMDIK